MIFFTGRFPCTVSLRRLVLWCRAAVCVGLGLVGRTWARQGASLLTLAGLCMAQTLTAEPRLGNISPITQNGIACATTTSLIEFSYTVNGGSNTNGNVNNCLIVISNLPAGVSVVSG